MDTKKLFAAGLAVLFVAGCGPKNDDQIVTDAIQKTVTELEKAKTDTNLDVEVTLAKAGGMFEASLGSEQQSSTSKEQGTLAIDFETTGPARVIAEAQGAPAKGELEVSFVREGYDMYMKIDKVEVEPAEMQAMISMVAGQFIGEDFHLNIKDLYSMMGMPMDIDMTKDQTMYESIMQGIEMQSEIEGAKMSTETAQKIFNKILAGTLFDVTSKEDVQGGIKYNLKPNVSNILNLMIEISEDVAGDKITDADRQAMKDDMAAMQQSLEEKKIFEYVNMYVVVGSDSYIAEYGINGNIPVEDATAPVSKIKFDLSVKMTDINKPFNVTVPETSQEFMETVMGYFMMGTPTISPVELDDSSVPTPMADPMGGMTKDEFDNMSDEDFMKLMDSMGTLEGN